MAQENDRNKELEHYFHEMVRQALEPRLGKSESKAVEGYVAGLLANFLHENNIYAIKNDFGHRLTKVPEMLAEGDVLQKAPNFEREREVHRHVGDFLLFWSGMFPEFLPYVGVAPTLPDAARQGKESYLIVSTFDYSPWDVEAPTFKKLSETFEECQIGLNHIRRNLKFSA